MVYLFNSLPFLIVLIFGLIIRYAVPSMVGKLVFGVIGIMVMFFYFQIQPSYMPKGEVKRSDIVFDYGVKEMRESNMRKPVDVEVWDAKMKEEREAITKRLGE